jgi:PII-like signaling protein
MPGLGERLVKSLVAQAYEVQLTSVEVHHGPYGFGL